VATVKLVRPRFGRKVAGVCAGVAGYYGWDVTVVRLVVVLATVFSVFSLVLAYLVAWVVIPEGDYALPRSVDGTNGF
jgi:phage shock protein C